MTIEDVIPMYRIDPSILILYRYSSSNIDSRHSPRTNSFLTKSEYMKSGKKSSSMEYYWRPPMDVSSGRPPKSRWKPPFFHWRPNIFDEDPIL